VALLGNPLVPIVFTLVADPIGGGFVASVASPGGNVSGFIRIEPPLAARWVGLDRNVDRCGAVGVTTRRRGRKMSAGFQGPPSHPPLRALRGRRQGCHGARRAKAWLVAPHFIIDLCAQ
jgi:hypothetical protein